MEDRNAVIFNQQFDDILSSHVFPKNGNDDDDDDDQKKTKKPCSGNAGLVSDFGKVELNVCDYSQPITAVRRSGTHQTRLMTWSPLFPMLFDLMMALRSTEAHDINLKNLILLRPKLSAFQSNNHIARFVNCFGDGYHDGTFYSIEQLITFRRDLRLKAVIAS